MRASIPTIATNHGEAVRIQILAQGYHHRTTLVNVQSAMDEPLPPLTRLQLHSRARPPLRGQP